MLEINKPKVFFKISKVEHDIYTFYFINDKKRTMEGKTITGKIPCRFKKGVEIEHDTRIFINKAYLDWYKKGAETRLQVFITDFEKVNQRGEEKKQAISEFAESEDFDFGLEEFDF